ncbi:hypothetical protein WJ30_07195 [Burkholderia diffusa]|nr:hypothetical protein WJ30_07195 [Burkholderia diffusa]
MAVVSAFVEAVNLLLSEWEQLAIAPTHLFIPRRSEWAVTRTLQYRRRPAQRTASMRRARKLKYRWYR